MRSFVTLFFATMLLLLIVGCKRQGGVTLHSAEVAKMEWSAEDVEQSGLPESVVLALDVENKGAAVVLRSGRVRVSYRGRRVAMFTLEEKVRIAGHKRSEVNLPLKINVARNSQTAALWQALQRHDAEGISVDWDAVVRAGVVRANVERSPMPLAELMQGEALDKVWSLADQMIK